MADYPEHEKLAKISDESQAIGHFLDFGLAEQNLALYERFDEPCECHQCRVKDTTTVADIHCEADRIEDGQAIYIRYRPTMKTIKAILAKHFDIDQKKLDIEKDQMLAAIRS